jgi:hypothetical protein
MQVSLCQDSFHKSAVDYVCGSLIHKTSSACLVGSMQQDVHCLQVVYYKMRGGAGSVS